MSKHPHIRTSVSALIGAPVVDAAGTMLGRVREMTVEAASDTGHVAAIVYKVRGRQMIVPVRDVQFTPAGAFQLVKGAEPVPFVEAEHGLLLERDLLDQQIIDVHGRKVVRVNDVELVWQNASDGLEAGDVVPHERQLRIADVEIGVRGAVRRLLKGMPQGMVANIAHRFAQNSIPWDFVDLIESDPARRVKLKIEGARLAKMHPSDIADILAELAPAEREALFTSLDEETAAETLEEVEPKLQKALIEGLDTERVAGIVEEMDPAAAADLLAELTEEKSDAILEEMDPEERHEVEELLEFPEDSAAGQMTTDYVSVSVDGTVADAVQALREFEGDAETVTEIYLLDGNDVLLGIIPLAKLVLAERETLLKSIPEPHFVSCRVDAHSKDVVELFDKYNLRSLAIVDEDQKLAGVVHAEQVIALLRAES